MIKCISIISFIFLTSSCTYTLKEGLYRFENNSEFSILPNKRYEFQTLNRSRPFAFSKGSYKVEGSKVNFYPDSNFLFQTKVDSAYFDVSLQDKIKLIIRSDNLDGVNIYFFDQIGDTLLFDKDLIKMVEKSEFKRDQIAIFAELTELTKKILPRPVNTIIVSNVILFSDISERFGKWNVLHLNLNIQPRMFSFIELGNYQYQKGKLIKLGWPIYEYNGFQ